MSSIKYGLLVLLIAVLACTATGTMAQKSGAPAETASPGVQATLPTEIETGNHLRQMKIGEGGWTVPWAMVVDQQGRLYLNSNYTFNPAEIGTACLYVERHADGYYVWARLAKDIGYTWDRGDSSWGRDLPVRQIDTDAYPPTFTG